MTIVKDSDIIYFVDTLGEELPVMAVDPDVRYPENGNAWHLHDGHGTIVMIRTSLDGRWADILRYSDVFNCEFSKKGLFEAGLRIRQLAAETNGGPIDQSPDLSVCMARGDRAFMMKRDGAVFELTDTDFSVMHILTAYNECRDIPDVYERIRAAYERAHAYHCFPLVVINTGNDDRVVLTRDGNILR